MQSRIISTITISPKAAGNSILEHSHQDYPFNIDTKTTLLQELNTNEHPLAKTQTEKYKLDQPAVPSINNTKSKSADKRWNSMKRKESQTLKNQKKRNKRCLKKRKKKIKNYINIILRRKRRNKTLSKIT